MKMLISDTWLFRLFTVFVVSVLMGMSIPAQAAWETPTAPVATLAAQQAAPAVGITATVREPFYKITTADVAAAVAEQLQQQGVEAKAEVIVNPGTANPLYSADHPMNVVIHTLQIDTGARRWQAQANFVGKGKTESVVPVSGTYGAMVDVPVVTKQFSRNDVIDEKDIEMRSMPERLLRKDTVMDVESLVGKSPRSAISAGRPIHNQEISMPIVIKRGDIVEMLYSTPYIKIKATGIALEDGTAGKLIRVKNQKSERAISAKVQSAGQVTVHGASL